MTVILGLPEDGIPMFLADDAEEFIKGIKGARKRQIYREKERCIMFSNNRIDCLCSKKQVVYRLATMPISHKK
ncbi:MAG: hypothetical protein UZ19_OD1000178 [Parcubacteria bacterium OLB19]|nr:MAG: hypothetical protein UZ19_OD1000178 [Parcubacteria bacterium OLB19]